MGCDKVFPIVAIIEISSRNIFLRKISKLFENNSIFPISSKNNM
jgi:hypothetical protein